MQAMGMIQAATGLFAVAAVGGVVLNLAHQLRQRPLSMAFGLRRGRRVVAVTQRRVWLMPA